MPSPSTTRLLLAAFTFAMLTTLGCTSNSSDHPLAGIIEPFQTPTPGEAARDAFNMHDADTRRNSVTLLAASPFGGEEPYQRLYRLLTDDPDPTVRAVTMKAIGMHGTVDDARFLIAGLKDRNVAVRWEAAKGLQRLHSSAAVVPLMTTMKEDEDADVRMSAATALGQYPQPAVFQALVGGLDDRNFGVVKAAHQSLALLTGYDFGTDASLWLIWAEQNPGQLFEKSEDYTWKAYVRTPSTIDKMKFWRKYEQPAAQKPTGLD